MRRYRVVIVNMNFNQYDKTKFFKKLEDAIEYFNFLNRKDVYLDDIVENKTIMSK